MRLTIRKILEFITICVFLFHTNDFAFAQVENDSLKIQRSKEFYELLNKRNDEYFNREYDLLIADTVQLADSVVVTNSVWSLSEIFYLCINDQTSNDGYRVLVRYLTFFNDRKSRIKLITFGYSVTIPNVEELLLKEKENGYVSVPLFEAFGCVMPHSVNKFVRFVERFEY